MQAMIKSGRRKKPAKAEPTHEKMAADRELFAQLQHDGFEGQHMEALQDDLWLYGWKCLRAWMRNGTIIERCAEKNIKISARYTEVEAMQRKTDLRDGLAVDSVQPAVEYFTRTLLPEGGGIPRRVPRCVHTSSAPASITSATPSRPGRPVTGVA